MSSIKTGLQSEINNHYCTNWIHTSRSSIKGMEKQNIWLIHTTNNYESTSTYICLVANEMRNLKMLMKGKAVGQNAENRVPEGTGCMGEGVTMMTSCHGDNCIPHWHTIHPAYIFLCLESALSTGIWQEFLLIKNWSRCRHLWNEHATNRPRVGPFNI